MSAQNNRSDDNSSNSDGSSSSSSGNSNMEEWEGDEEDFGPAYIESLEKFQLVLDDLKEIRNSDHCSSSSPRDDENDGSPHPIEKYIDDSQRIVFEKFVGSSDMDEEKEYLRLLAETLEVLSEIQCVQEIDFQLLRDGRHGLNVMGSKPVSTTSPKNFEVIFWFECQTVVNFDNDGSSSRSTANHLEGDAFGLHRVIEALQHMHILYISKLDDFLVERDGQRHQYETKINLADTFKSKAEKLTLWPPVANFLASQFPRLRELTVYKEVSVENTDALISQLKLLPNLERFEFLSGEFSVARASAIAALRLKQLGIRRTADGSGTVTKDELEALLTGIQETGTLQSLALVREIQLDGADLLCEKIPKLTSLRNLTLGSLSFGVGGDCRPDISEREGLIVGMKLVEAIKNNLYLFGVDFYPGRSRGGSVFQCIQQNQAGINHTLKLNQAGRRILQEMTNVAPNLIPHILSNAGKAYDGMGIYFLLREHSDLRMTVASYGSMTTAGDKCKGYASGKEAVSPVNRPRF